jgi:type II secretory pathway pseudopilin PulG
MKRKAGTPLEFANAESEIASLRAVSSAEVDEATASRESGFTLAEMLIAMAVFTLIIGSVVALLAKSQTIFRTEQGVSEMDQNARLLMDFMTRDIQESKENSLGLGQRFRSIYSYDGPEGKTDEVTIVSSDTQTKVPSAALPLIAASPQNFSIGDRHVTVLPNGASRVDAQSVINSLTPDEEFIVSGSLQDGSFQFDFIKIKGAKLTADGAIGITFEPMEPKGVQPEVPFGATYEGGSFTMRPSTIKRYFVDRKTDREHPMFQLAVNDGTPITIARNVVAFQLRYLEVRDGDVEGQWVKQQNISRQYKTIALEVTMTARTEIKSDQQAERLVTLASVIRPRLINGGSFGSAPGDAGTSSPGVPGDGGNAGGGGGTGGRGGSGSDPGGYPGSYGGGNGGGSGPGGYGDGSGAFGGDGYKHETRRIGKLPRLGERLNQRP